MFKSSSLMVRILFLALCSLLALSVRAQEPVATQEPVPVIVTNEALPTVEAAPLETVMPVETGAATPDATEVVAPVIVETPVTPEASPVTNPESIPATPFAPEPPLQLLVRETLDNGDLSPWSLGEEWTLVPSGSGQMLQVSNSNTPADLLKGDFFNVAVQAEFFLQAGAAQITVRQSEAGNYTATLDASGLVRLFRSSEFLLSQQGMPSTVGQANTLRLSAIDGIVRVSVNGIEIIAVRDELPLPPGKVRVSADFTLSADGNPVLENVLLVNDFFLWVKADESALYPSPTSIVAATGATAQPTLDAAEIVDVTIPETPATPELSLEPIESAPVESAPIVAAPVEEPLAPAGKDSTQFAAPSAAQIAQAGGLSNDNFADASVIPSAHPLNAYISAGDTTAATLEANETVSTCNFNTRNTIWFAFTPSITANYTVSTANSGFDTVVAIYTGTSVDNLTLVGCNDDATAATFTSLLTQSLQLNVTYHIQVGGYNGRYGSYAVSVVQMGLPAPTLAPVLTGPNDNVLTNNIAVPLPAMTWNAVLANTHHYEIQIDDNKLFTSIDQQNSQIIGTNYEVLPPLPMLLPTTPTTYYWRVRALNISNQPGPWSLVRRFIVDTAPPPVPTLGAPANNALLTTLRPAFSWTTPIGSSTGYLLDVDDAAADGVCDFLAPVINNLSVTLANSSTSVLPQGSYCWRVQSVDRAGNPSGESLVRHFKIFIGTAPLDNALVMTVGTGLTSNVLFKWVGVPGTTNYKLTLFDETCTTPKAGYPMNVGVVLTKTLAVEHGKYCWNVQAESAEVATPTIFRKLMVSPPGALPPVLTNPTALQVIGDNTPEFMWNASVSTLGTPFTYTLQADNSGCLFPTPEVNKAELGLSHTPAALVKDGPYCWRVRTVNTYGVAGPWSLVRSFTLDTTLPAAPTMALPAANAIVSAVRPSFHWVAAVGSGSVSYLLDIDDDPELDGTCDFATMILTNHAVTKTPYVLPASVPLLPQGGYCWRVQALDAAGNVGPETTVPRAFKVFIGTAPLPIDKALFTPVGAATSVNVAFAWAEVPGATSYVLTLYDATCTTPDAGFPLNMALVRTKTQAVSRGTHCWKVQAVGVEAGTPPTFGKVIVSPAGPAAPVLTSPTAAQLIGDTTPEFKWNATLATANAPFTYEMQVDNSGCLFPSPEVYATGLGLSHTPSTPLMGGTYCWRARSVNTFGGAGAWGAGRSFTLDTTAPKAPSLLLPADKAALTVLRPSLNWSMALGSGTVRYLLDIANDPDLDGSCDFTGAAIENREITKVPYAFAAPTAPLPQGSYCWRVQAVDAAGNISSESAVRTFKIFIGSLPLDKAIVYSPTTANVIFKWVAVVGATSYTLKLFDQTCTTEQFSYDVGLLLTKTAPVPHGVYCWKVQAVGMEASVPMTFRKLTVSPAASVAPVLVTPIVNGVTGDSTPDFSWNAVPAVASLTFTYDLMVDNNGCLFPSAEINLTGLGLSHTPSTPLNDGTYCWKVRAINNHGIAGAWSANRNVVVDTAATGTSTLIAPLDNASLSVPQPAFTWGRVVGAKSYQIQLKTAATSCEAADVPLIDVPSPALGNISFVPSSPLLNRTYYWCVRAIDAGGNPSPWTTRRAVKIISAATAASILNRFTTSPVTLSWGAINWAVPNGYYQVQVDNNTTFASPEFQSANLTAGAQTIEIPIASPLSSGTWYWRVRACPAVGACGAWSTSGIFTIES